MPFLVDSGPPVDAAALSAARAELPREYGTRFVEQRGRKALLVRVPRSKPDYNYELAVVAFYVTESELRDVKDVLLIGDEKSVRMEPLRLRDHVREQTREDREVAPQLRARLARDYGWTMWVSPVNNHHRALAFRLPANSIAEANEAMLLRARAAAANDLVQMLRDTQFVYLLSDTDFARVGRRVFVEAVASDLADVITPPESSTANPLHLTHQTPGNSIGKLGGGPSYPRS